MVRNVFAVLGGWVISIVAWFLMMISWSLLARMISPDEFPLPQADVAIQPPMAIWFLVGTLVCDALAGAMAGYLIAWWARKPAHTLMWIVTSLMAIALIVQVAAGQGTLPLWLGMLRVIVMPVGLWVGARWKGLDPKEGDQNPRRYDMREKNMAC